MNKDLRLSANIFLNLIDVFKTKGWEIPSDTSGMESRFNRFCERLSILDTKEQQLVIELTRRFTDISGNEYLQLIIKLLNRICDEGTNVFSATKKFFILPLVAPQDFNRTKSSSFVWYYFRDELVKYNPLFAGKNLVYCDIEKASWISNLETDEMVILVDDYVGSGETAVGAIKWLVDSFKTDPKQIVILSIAAQEFGVKHISQETGVVTYSYYQFTRGISDFYSGDQRDDYLETMNGIEDKLKVDSEDRLGYNKSEALISLIRTPNNTFPVFWKAKNKSKPAPFPRD